jgi:hypothetical protein
LSGAPRGGYAELIADGGASAVGELGAGVATEFFRSAHFLEAEAATHTLRIEAGGVELLAPLLVRPVGDTTDLDAISPYGYPGFTVRSSGRYPGGSANGEGGEGGEAEGAARPAGAPGSERATGAEGSAGAGTAWGAEDGHQALDPATIDFGPTGLVAAFVRHRLDLVPLAGTSERNVVQIADPAQAPKSRPSDRRQIRRNLEAGYTVELVAGTDTTAAQRAAFLDVYEQTMRRTAAGAHYFFGAAYFDLALAVERTWLCLARTSDGAVAAASLAVVSDGFLHYYLSGSADSALGDSPMKNVLARLVELAGELALPLNLGGGLAPGDALEEFKRGFANRTLGWRTSELVCDPARYAELSAGRGGSDFFPAYRA